MNDRNRLMLAVPLLGGSLAIIVALWVIWPERYGPPHARRALAGADERSDREVTESRLHALHLASHVGASCGDCHEITASEFKPPRADQCRSCHKKRESTMHVSAAAESAPRECRTCHQFNPKPGAEEIGARLMCGSCHDEPQKDHPAIVVHGSETCIDCHRPHEMPSLQPRACTDCHAAQQTSHDSKKIGSARCLACHRAHQPKTAALGTCASCHQQQERALVHGKQSCTSCHRPHRFEAAAARSCRSCHRGKAVLAEAKSKTHNNCRSCHASPHAPAKGALASCETCHQKVRAKHPGTPKGACVGCHPPHPQSAAMKLASAAPCSSCHTKAASDSAFHAGGSCTGCHAKHSPLTNVVGRCATCHAAESAGASHNRGHQKCTSCHKKHAVGAKPPGCAGCHKVQARTAPRGHQTCKSCHDTHSGKRRAAATCASCHPKRASGPHARVKNGCATCHRAHGPRGVRSPPSCQSCHAPSSLPGMHRVAKHQRCQSCHTSHSAPRGDRKTCLTCHRAQRTHEPNATSCVGCHVFGKGTP